MGGVDSSVDVFREVIECLEENGSMTAYEIRSNIKIQTPHIYKVLLENEEFSCDEDGEWSV